VVPDGELNVAYNCVDRHVEAGLGDKVAYHWIGEPGETRTITYADLMRETSKAANALLELGVTKGDRVAIYMPMIPELRSRCSPAPDRRAAHGRVRRVLRRGAVRADQRLRAKVLITADGGWRRGKKVGLKHHADEAVADTPTIEHVIIVDRFGDGAHMVPRRDHWWHELVDDQSEDCPPVAVDSEHMLYLLYTSGTTAKPKGILPHRLPATCSARRTATGRSSTSSPMTCTGAPADIGWVTGHSYIVYGPLANADRPA
jgi:acetyl-CoA synthetase